MKRDDLYFTLTSLRMPRVVSVDERSASVPKGLNGLRALFATDLHMGSALAPKWYMDRLFQRLAALKPDLVLWGGDYAERDYHKEALERMAKLTGALGMFAVLGNNDQRAFASQRGLFDRAEMRSGLVTLVNGSRRVPVEGGSLNIIGIDEPKEGAPDLSVLNEPKRPGEYRILLSHSPLALAGLPDDIQHPPDLILCGHTHGGQLSLFGLNPYTVGYEREFDHKHFHVSGDHPLGSARMIVSNGIGTSLVPLRVGAPPEVHLVKFTSIGGEDFPGKRAESP